MDIAQVGDLGASTEANHVGLLLLGVPEHPHGDGRVPTIVRQPKDMRPPGVYCVQNLFWRCEQPYLGGVGPYS